jgi:NTP pyrophosphatase (non-canonical NTP hydrolase)
MSEIDRVTEKILAFRNAREWAQFHNPKDLAAGLAIEAAELQEIFLWKAADEVAATAANKRAAISEELADVLWYVLLLAHELGIDPLRAVEQKLELNAAKYPVDKAKGKHAKYTDL